MILNTSEKRRFTLVMLADSTLAGLSNDGLIYIFELSEEVIKKLDEKYPNKNQGGWYFNHSNDRYAAERCNGRLYVNPSVASLLFGNIVDF